MLWQDACPLRMPTDLASYNLPDEFNSDSVLDDVVVGNVLTFSSAEDDDNDDFMTSELPFPIDRTQLCHDAPALHSDSAAPVIFDSCVLGGSSAALQSNLSGSTVAPPPTMNIKPATRPVVLPDVPNDDLILFSSENVRPPFVMPVIPRFEPSSTPVSYAMSPTNSAW